MADYCTYLSVLLPIGSAGNIGPALALYRQLADELDAEDQAIGFEAEAHEPPGTACLWLHADGDGEPEHVITFILRCAEMLGLVGRWGFCWALMASRPRLNAFGGGAQLLDLGQRTSVDWVDCHHWLEMHLAADRTDQAPAGAGS